MTARTRLGTAARRPVWVLVTAGWLTACILGATAALALATPQAHTLGFFELRPRLTLQPGRTVIEIPPLGALTAQTHRSPLGLAVEVRAVDFAALQGQGGTGDLVAALQGEIEAVARRFSAEVILIAAAGAFAAVLAALALGAGQGYPGYGRHRLAAAVAAPVATALILAGCLGVTWATYDPTAFQEPEYTGALKSAPWMISLAEQALRGAERLGERLAAVAEGINAMFERLEGPEALGARPGELAVVVVSDVHNNPAAVDLVKAVARAFQGALIIDAGDLTDWGTALESRLVGGLQDLDVPYLLVPGNHETPALIEELAARSRIQVLSDGIHEVAGISIAAVVDPAAGEVLPAVAPESELAAAARRLEILVDEAAARGGVDLVVAHNPSVVEAVVDRVPTVVSGHTHRSWIRPTAAGVWLNPGTTGAAGLRGLESGDIPYELMVLHLSREGERWRPVAVDTIRASGFEAGFSVERTVLRPIPALGAGTADAP